MLGGEVDPRTASEEWIALIDVPAMGILGFQKVPEAKATKNRVHIDLEVADIATAVSAAVTAGAQVTGGVVVEPTNRFQLMRMAPGTWDARPRSQVMRVASRAEANDA